MIEKKKTAQKTKPSHRKKSPVKKNTVNPVTAALSTISKRLLESGDDGVDAVGATTEQVLCGMMEEHDLLLVYNIRLLDCDGNILMQNVGHSSLGHLSDPAALSEAPEVLASAFNNNIWRPLRTKFIAWVNANLPKPKRQIGYIEEDYTHGRRAGEESDEGGQETLGLPSGSPLSD